MKYSVKVPKAKINFLEQAVISEGNLYVKFVGK